MSTTSQGYLNEEDEIKLLRSENERMRAALEKIADGYGPQHGSRYCHNVAALALERALA